MKRKILIFAAVLIAIVVLFAVVLPLLFDANRYRPDIESRLSQSLGRKVKIGSLKLAIFSGGIQAKNISIADDPAFGREPFVKAKSLEVGVQMKPLLFDKQVKIESLVLDEPQVRLLQSPAGKWNYSSLGQKQSKSGQASATSIEVKKLEIADGRMEVGRANGKQVAFTHVYMKASDISEKTSFPFSVSARAQNDGELRVDGKAGPVNNTDTSRTPFTGDVKISNLDLAAIGMMGSDSSIGGVLDYTGKMVSDGSKVTSDGTATAVKLRLVKGGGTAKNPVEVKYHSTYDLATEQGSVERTTVQTGKSTANLAGTFASQGTTTDLNMNLTANKMNVEDIQGLLPALGIVLPAGSTLQGGTVDANLNVQGPLEKLVTMGTVNIANTKLTGYSLTKGLAAVASLAGLPLTSDTTIQTLSSSLRVAPEGIRADNLLLAVPELGTVTGNGTVAADSALDFHLVAKLANGGGAIGALTQLAGMKGGLKELPFAVKGTTAKPVFIPQIGSALAGAAASGSQAGQQQQANPVGSILQLFGKKKK